MAKRRNDWHAIKAAYVEGTEGPDGKRIYPTLEELAKKHGLHVTSLRKKSAADEWQHERNLFATRVADARQEKKVELLSAKGAEIDARALKVAETGLALCQTQLAALAKAAVMGGDEAKLRLPTGAIEALSKSLVNFQRAARLAIGDPTDTLETTENGPGVAGLLRQSQEAGETSPAGEAAGAEPG